MRAKWAVLGIVGALALAGSGIVAAGSGERDVMSEQPIAFPHDVHAGTLEIPCMYCHNSADRSPDAGIPSMQTCAGCHLPTGSLLFKRESEELQKLQAYWDQQLAVPWVQIYRVPSHVRFPHNMHVSAGLECQQCHGPVQEMAEIEVAPTPDLKGTPLTMGWCINCHREREARIDCTVCHY